MCGTKHSTFLYFPGCKFVCLCLTIIITVTWLVVKLLQLQCSDSSSIIAIIQRPYFRYFGFPDVDGPKIDLQVVEPEKLRSGPSLVPADTANT
ncbi:hypothetical protein P879_07505 [Paragonimus westermani]|uniref:Uncharacterized protein n=1 Tax=Paragonimus westermani TaxID=34504 RepID=A0A8T0DCN6_9TREM|nr:hypothetical protein P879_07505 [Paragonimus westermani]